VPTTYTLIASSVLGSNQSTVSFSSIPATYTDLIVTGSIRSSNAGIGNQLSIWFNTDTDTATTYSYTYLRGTGTAASSSRSSNTGDTRIFDINGNGSTASVFSNTEIYIPNYRASINKPFSAFSTMENNASASFMGVNAFLWRNTAAITAITLASQQYASLGTTLLAGSSFYLYGIKNS
jgi:hypothetical protein